MVCQRWIVAALALFAVGLTPLTGQSQTTPSGVDREAVHALSKRIDEHLARVWKKAGVVPAPKAEEHVFFRRLNLDLTGRIPELMHIYDFTDPSNTTDKRWDWVERFLESPEYAEHLANVWRNIIIGNQPNQQLQFLMPQFEAWLRERVKTNLPLDKLVQQLLTSEQNNANMRIVGLPNNQNAPSPQLYFVAAENKPENLAGVTSRVFLGVKIECAQCHAHPFAKWKKDQFWEFAAFFSAPAQNQQFVPGLQPKQPKLKFQPGREIMIPGTTDIVKAKYLTGEDPQWEGSTSSRKILSTWITSAKNPYFARAMADHLWSYFMGVSLLEPIMEPNDDLPVTHPDLLNDLAQALIDNNFDAKFLIRAIVHSEAYQRSSGGTKLADREDYHLFVRMPIRALSPEQLYDSVMMVTERKAKESKNPSQPFFNPNQMQNKRAQFLAKFTDQDRRHEPQTSILQALFLMNGKFMAEKTKVENNDDLRTLASPDSYKEGHAARVKTLYRLVLSRPSRPEESSRLVAFLERCERDGILGEGISDIYWALLNSSEFMHNH